MRIVVQINASDSVYMQSAECGTQQDVDKLLHAIITAARATWPDYQPSLGKIRLINSPETKP
jgi:hypothetical protein